MLSKRLTKDNSGAVEGLPLQLIIMVAVAAIVLVIVLAWLAPWQNKVDLDSLSVSTNTVTSGEETTITVTAWDTKGNHLKGVVIEMSGCNVNSTPQTTDLNGVATFTITPSISPTSISGQIQVTGKYTGAMYAEKTAFIVVS